MNKTLLLQLVFVFLCYARLHAQESKITEIDVDATGGVTLYQRMSGSFSNVKGKHNVSIVWNNHASNVRNIYFDNSSALVSIGKTFMGLPKIFAGKGLFRIHDAKKGSLVEVFDLSGKNIDSFSIRDNPFERKAASGFYIIRIIDKEHSYSSKIIIK